jgi:ComF family protein
MKTACVRPLLNKAAGSLLNLVFPEGNLCHICGQPGLSGAEVWLCDACCRDLNRALIPSEDQPLFIAPEIPMGLAAYHYESIAQELVHGLKYRGDAATAAPLAEGMASAFALAQSPKLRAAELLIPVPLHPRREKERGYNQAALLAERLSAHVGLPHHPRALERIRYTGRQVSANREHRLRNMSSAFAVADIPLVYRRRILLVDDVCTTGATAIACAYVLLSCGAKEVSLLTACRA